MVPYTTRSVRTTTYSACDSSTSSTTGYRDWNEDESVTFTAFQIPKEEEIPVFLKEKPHFDRMIRLRNTDGRLFKSMVWKPIRG